MESELRIQVLPYLIAVPFVLLSLASWIWFMYTGLRFSKYLKRKYPEEWKKITTISGFGPGCANPFRWFPFIFGSEDFGDQTLLDLKTKCRNASLYFLVSIPAVFIALQTSSRYVMKMKSC